jgi:hypothetical protein
MKQLVVIIAIDIISYGALYNPVIHFIMPGG